MEAFKAFILHYQEELIEERKDSFDGSIVEAIYNIISSSGLAIEEATISPQDIIDEGQIMDYKGKLMHPRGLFGHLKSLGFEKSRVRLIQGKSKRCIPMKKDHLLFLFKRYGFNYTITKITDYTVTCGKSGEPPKPLIPINSESPPYNRNLRNNVMDSYMKSITDEVLPVFNVYHKCFVEGCQSRECAFDRSGVPYCSEHWEEMALKEVEVK
jgi:hypothetical protein